MISYNFCGGRALRIAIGILALISVMAVYTGMAQAGLNLGTFEIVYVSTSP